MLGLLELFCYKNNNDHTFLSLFHASIPMSLAISSAHSIADFNSGGFGSCQRSEQWLVIIVKPRVLPLRGPSLFGLLPFLVSERGIMVSRSTVSPIVIVNRLQTPKISPTSTVVGSH